MLARLRQWLFERRLASDTRLAALIAAAISKEAAAAREGRAA
jgi:hypothetical protein